MSDRTSALPRAHREGRFGEGFAASRILMSSEGRGGRIQVTSRSALDGRGNDAGQSARRRPWISSREYSASHPMVDRGPWSSCCSPFQSAASPFWRCGAARGGSRTPDGPSGPSTQHHPRRPRGASRSRRCSSLTRAQQARSSRVAIQASPDSDSDSGAVSGSPIALPCPGRTHSVSSDAPPPAEISGTTQRRTRAVGALQPI